MTDQEALKQAQGDAAVILAYWRYNRPFEPLADRVFMLICARTFGECKTEERLSMCEMTDALSRCRSQVSAAVKTLMDQGVISRRRVQGDMVYRYRIEADAVLELGYAA